MKKLYVRNEGGNSHAHFYRGRERGRYSRHTKNGMRKSMNVGKDGIYGKYNFDPLFKHLLKQVGKRWEDVWKDVFPRVDSMSEPIKVMVINCRSNGTAFEIDPETSRKVFRFGETAFWSTLYVDNEGILRYVDRDYEPEVLYGGGWGQSFNSHPVTKLDEKYKSKFRT